MVASSARVTHPWLLVLGASRPISWVNTAFPFAAAYLLSGGGFDWRLVIGTVFFLIPYNIAMYGINDVFDYESDIRNPRKGGVEGTVIPKSAHRLLLRASWVTTLPFLVVLLFAGTATSAVWLLISAFMVVAYSMKGLRFKEIPFLDSITSSAHFVTPALVGATMTGQPLGGWFIAALVSFFFWGMASHALGAIQDVTSDRAAGLASIATVLGAAKTALVTTVWYVLAVVIVALCPWPSQIVALAITPYALNAARFIGLTDRQCSRARGGWQFFLYYNFVAGSIITITMLAVVLR
ncbi:prenyltransferase [Corynebacterium choanae]|uniref:Prenyltransferase n=1 Tax=Corynebacterium choanae TaxID=1862358 RepID=A0A3G6J325_9CORY|nr:prenyltransferase [Corynebacterium choanae]AZA12455.1 prenyltransferase [Corynebacterium choanae]